MRSLLAAVFVALLAAPTLQAHFPEERSLGALTENALLLHGGFPATALVNGAVVPWSEADFVLRQLPGPDATAPVDSSGDVALASRRAGNEPCWWTAAITGYSEGPTPGPTLQGVALQGAPFPYQVPCGPGLDTVVGAGTASPAPGASVAAVCLANGLGTQRFLNAKSLCIAGPGNFQQASLTGHVGAVDVVACNAWWCAHSTAVLGGPVENLPPQAWPYVPRTVNNEANVVLAQVR